MQANYATSHQAMLAAIVDSSEDAIISKDLQSRVTSWNSAAERMFGYSSDEMIGQDIRILIPLERRQEEDEIISRLKKGERVEHYETIRLTKKGQKLNVSLTISPVKDDTGVIRGASKIARDITRQKQNEERLQVINQVGKSVSATLDTEVILQSVTDATTRLSGAAFGAFFYNKVDSRGETYMLYALSGVSREAFAKYPMPRNTPMFKSTFEGIAIVRSDNIKLHPDYGKNLPYRGMPDGHLDVTSYLAIPVISQSGSVLGGLFFGHPEEAVFTIEHEEIISAIASHAAVALDNAKLYSTINALNRKKDQFIGFASHELKTPLTTIKGYLQIASMNAMPADTAYKKITKQVERLEGIVADLLNISKIRAGKMDIEVQKINLNELVRESVDAVDAKRHHIHNELPQGEFTIVADKKKMVQVLVNLLSNALKFSAEGTAINVNTQVFGDEVEVEVADQGVGIPAEHLTNIFNEFYRVSSEQNKAPGMGLGLYISKEIIEAHGGRIWAESTLGIGSTFHVRFPIEHRALKNSKE